MNLKRFVTRYRREFSVALAHAFFLLLLAVAAPRILRFRAASRVRGPKLPVLVAAIGMTSIIVCRQIDISVGSQFSICGVVAGLLAKISAPCRLSAWERFWPGLEWGRSTADSWLGSECLRSSSPQPRW